MRGAWLAKGLVGVALLASHPSVCLAEDGHDLNLERAVKEIVARKIGGDMRGTLTREWHPPPMAQSAEAPKRPELEPEAKSQSGSGSFITIDPPALALSAIRAATAMVVPHPRPRKVRIVYQ